MRDLKSSDVQIKELNNRLYESESEIAQVKVHAAKLSSENSRLKANLDEEEQKSSFLNKENAALSSKLK